MGSYQWITFVLIPLWQIWMRFYKCNFHCCLPISIFRYIYDNVLSWILRVLTDDYSKVVQVLAYCCQATRHYLNQYWPRLMPPYGNTRHKYLFLTVYKLSQFPIAFVNKIRTNTPPTLLLIISFDYREFAYICAEVWYHKQMLFLIWPTSLTFHKLIIAGW